MRMKMNVNVLFVARRDREAGGLEGGGFSSPNNFQEIVFSFSTNFIFMIRYRHLLY